MLGGCKSITVKFIRIQCRSILLHKVSDYSEILVKSRYFAKANLEQEAEQEWTTGLSLDITDKSVQLRNRRQLIVGSGCLTLTYLST